MLICTLSCCGASGIIKWYLLCEVRGYVHVTTSFTLTCCLVWWNLPACHLLLQSQIQGMFGSVDLDDIIMSRNLCDTTTVGHRACFQCQCLGFVESRYLSSWHHWTGVWDNRPLDNHFLLVLVANGNHHPVPIPSVKIHFTKVVDYVMWLQPGSCGASLLLWAFSVSVSVCVCEDWEYPNDEYCHLASKAGILTSKCGVVC